MKKLSYLIVLVLILGLVLTGCSLLSNIGQAPATGQKCIGPIEVPVCFGAGGGKTIGFWGNKNGQKILTDTTNWTTITNSVVLSNLILKGQFNADVISPYLNDAAAVKVFLKNATAKDMRYMLAAQWLAMQFNVLVGDVNGGDLVYLGDLDEDGIYDTEEFMSVGWVLANVSDNWDDWEGDRATQEDWKDILDDANNNLNFLVDCPPS